MINKKDIIELHKKQLKLEIDVIRLAIQHSAVKGSEAEFAFRRLIRKHLPQRYILGSGFVLNADQISHQHDIVVYDDFMNAPVFLGDNCGAFLGGAVYGILEITIAQLTLKKLEEDIKKIGDLRRIFPQGKVLFQRVKSCPILNQDELKSTIDQCLSSGYCIDDVWPEIQKKCISEEGAFVGDPSCLASVYEGDKERIREAVDKIARRTKSFIVKEGLFYSTPPPRTYLCALDGASYKTIDSLSRTVRRLTKRHGAHVHGLLILNQKGGDWFLSTKAFSDYEVEIQTKDAFFYFLESMKCSFQGMLVGKYPAGDIKR